MAKSSLDRNTIDLFTQTRGRPRTHILSRQEQLKANKKVQRLKQKQLGLKRIEVILDNETIERLDLLCELDGIKRTDWISTQINTYYTDPKNQKKIKKKMEEKNMETSNSK